jgi:hypothetical protein
MKFVTHPLDADGNPAGDSVKFIVTYRSADEMGRIA